MIERWSKEAQDWVTASPSQKRRTLKHLFAGDGSLMLRNNEGYQFHWINGEVHHLFHLTRTPKRDAEYASRRKRMDASLIDK